MGRAERANEEIFATAKSGKSKRYRGGATALRRHHYVQLAAPQRRIPRRPRRRPGYWRPWSLGHSICAKVRLSGRRDRARSRERAARKEARSERLHRQQI